MIITSVLPPASLPPGPDHDSQTCSESKQPSNTRPGPSTDRSLLVVVLSLVTLGFTYALVVLGSTVRVTESGMGCSSWPLCNGQIGLVGNSHALIEQGHRYLAGLVTVSGFATVWAAWRTTSRRAALAPSLVAAGLVLFQAGLGALTVFTHNAPWTVAIHLITGLVFLGVVTLTATIALVGGNHFRLDLRAAGHWASVALGATLLLLVSGAVVVDGGAARSCPSWPICTHPGPLHLIALQLLHRSLVAIASIAMVGFVVTSWPRMAERRRWHTAAAGLLVLLPVVASLGAASALSRAQATLQDLHLVLASALWALLVALVVSASVSPDAGESSSTLWMSRIFDRSS